ncbi:DNA polymerase IV [Halomonas dongshanensis]|uniref:DNA polymerase IV n=1 Tax=Halomonas dongshanensis TaxID=2890835 RepID=A0ABT2EHU1_9GAMM|nr:DNA polymerase IV [Halomonas dongshanensis]
MRKIIHCDCDCFYAAVEMRDNPALTDIPIAIGGSVEQRGVVATCNYPARKYGIHSAMPMAQALKRCPHLTVIRGDMPRYREAARQVFAIYRDVTELIEPLSLDEAFLDVSEVTLFKGSATRMAEAIRARVRREVGITVSAGVAPNKFLAKIASDWRKPDGLFVITPDEIESFVKPLPVKKIHGVGPRTAEKLAAMDIHTCEALRAWPLTELVEHFGRFGKRLHELSYGRDERAVKTHRERKSVSTEQTYAKDLPDLAACQRELPTLLADLERRFARLDPPPAIRGLMVKVKFNDFTQTTVEHADPAPNQAQFEALLNVGWARGQRPVRLLGVGYRLAEVPPHTQLTLF